MKCLVCGNELSHMVSGHQVSMYCGNRDCPQHINKKDIVEDTVDMVNHPPHYNQGKYEVIDVIEDNLKDEFPAYLVGNILKYTMRYKHKNGLQDLEKAKWYLEKLISKMKKPL